MIIALLTTLVSGNVCIIENKSTNFNDFLSFFYLNFNKEAYASEKQSEYLKEKVCNKKNDKILKIQKNKNKKNNNVKKQSPKPKQRINSEEFAVPKEKIKYTKFIGKDLVVRDYRAFDDKIVILYFWSTWSIESIEYLKLLNNLNKEFLLNKVYDFVIVPISTDFQDYEFLEQCYFANEIDTLEVYKDAESQEAVISENIKQIPTLFIINSNHEIIDLTDSLKIDSFVLFYKKIMEFKDK